MKKKIVVIGGGESGVGAAILAKKKGLEVFVSDNGSITNENKKVLSNNEIKWDIITLGTQPDIYYSETYFLNDFMYKIS